MKSVAAASAFLVAAAAAQPHHGGHGHLHNKRMATEVVWVTEIETVTEIVEPTTTYWITPSEAASTVVATSSEGGQFFEPISTTAEPATVVTATTTSTTSISTPSPAPQVEASTPAEVVPAPAPTTSSSPAPTSAPAPQPSPSTPSGGSSGGSGGAEHSGDITYYTIGLGACGEDDTGKDEEISIVALSHLLMGTESNGNPMCGKTIQIESNGRTTTAVVKDKCMGCAMWDIDVSEKVFQDLWGGLGKGRGPATWSFV